jgi:OHCU decarboxylase
MTLAEFNLAPADQAEEVIRRCCGSKRWSRLMTEQRPFANRDVLFAIAERLWWSLEAADWLEAFAAHPRLGDRQASGWAADEQSAATSMANDVRSRLVEGNHAYEERFGYTFIVCATGKSVDAILEILQARLTVDPAAELQVAAAEQRKITELRLAKLFTS